MSKYHKLTNSDFNLPCKDLALYLLNKVLARKLEDGTVLRGKIVETECYPGGDDKASQSFGGRRTPKNEPLYMTPGTAFVYMTYGMYYCLNISSIEPGGAVLLRALEPIQGQDIMEKFRLAKRKSGKSLPTTELCNGPSKLCMALNITKDACNAVDLPSSNILWLESCAEVENDDKIVTSTRIGINSVDAEWRLKPFRFYLLSSLHISKRDSKAEEKVANVNNK